MAAMEIFRYVFAGRSGTYLYRHVDRGRGIEKEFADSVFDRLFMMEDSRNSAMQGNGLGLTIAKNLALQLGGDITLESHPHQKTVFTITLKKMAY